MWCVIPLIYSIPQKFCNALHISAFLQVSLRLHWILSPTYLSQYHFLRFMLCATFIIVCLMTNHYYCAISASYVFLLPCSLPPLCITVDLCSETFSCKLSKFLVLHHFFWFHHPEFQISTQRMLQLVYREMWMVVPLTLPSVVLVSKL